MRRSRSSGEKGTIDRYLNRYERSRLFGDGGEEEEGESERGGRASRSSRSLLTSLATLDCPYTRPKNALPEAARRSLRLPAVPAAPYPLLLRSLQSGLPNELDFALNILTLLSHPGPKLLKLADAPAVLPLLLAHVGIFDDGPDSLAELYTQGWRTEARLPFRRFWAAGLPSVAECQDLLGSTPLKVPPYTRPCSF